MTITISFPQDIHCLLKVGDSINFGEPFLEKKEKKQSELFIAKDLGIQPKKIFRYLKKFVGDSVSRDEIVALKKDFFSEKKILSPFDGIIKEIDHDQGKIVLTINEKEKKVTTAYFQGEVFSLKKGYIELKVKKSSCYQIKKGEINFGGKVFYMIEEDFTQLSSNTVNNKLVVSPNITGLFEPKIEALGATGFVCVNLQNTNPSIPYAILKNPDDLKKIFEEKLTYCYVDQQSSKIFFYE